jgi:hypothetical protein
MPRVKTLAEPTSAAGRGSGADAENENAADDDPRITRTSPAWVCQVACILSVG